MNEIEVFDNNQQETYRSIRNSVINAQGKVYSANNADDTERKARSLEINPDFSLKVRFEDGTIRDIFSGEVSVRGLCGYLPD